jgi:hypothetical protein
VYNGVISGKTYAKGGMADVTPTYAAGGEISPETLTKFAEDLQQAESEAYDNLDIRSGGQLYRTPSLQKQYASAMNQAFAELTKKHAHLKDINVENAQTIYDYLEDQNYHSLNNYLALRGVFGTKYKQKYEGYHTKYPDNYLDPANMGGAQSYAVGGLTPGRWYKDNQGVEYKFIGKIDNGPNKDQLLFTDGTQKMYKPLDDFGEKPKENKLFGWFGDGGEIFKYVQNTFKDENGVVHIDAYTTSEDDDNEDYDEDEGTIVAYVFPDGRVAYLDARAKYDKNVQKVIKESGGNGVIEDLFEIPEYIPEEVQDVLGKYNEGLEEGDYEALKEAKKELESVGFTFDYDLGGGAFDLHVVDDYDAAATAYDIGDEGDPDYPDDWDVYVDGGMTKENLDKRIKKLKREVNYFKQRNLDIGYKVLSELQALKKYIGKSDVDLYEYAEKYGDKVEVNNAYYQKFDYFLLDNLKKVKIEGYRHDFRYSWRLKGTKFEVNAPPFFKNKQDINIFAIEIIDEAEVVYESRDVDFEKVIKFGLTGNLQKDVDQYFKLITPTFEMFAKKYGKSSVNKKQVKGKFDSQEEKEDYANDLKDYILEKYEGKSVLGYKLTDEAYDGNTPWVWKLNNKDIDVFAEPFNENAYERLLIEAYKNESEPIGRHEIEFDFTGYLDKDADNYIKLIKPYLKKYSIGNFGDGGMVTKYNVSFNYNPSNLKNKDAEKIVEAYTKDWKHDNDFDEVSFFAMRLNKEDADSLVKELKMEDVYNIEVDKSSYADGGKVKFADKVKSIQASLLKRKKVAPSVQKDYGKTYNKAEAKEAATRITGAMTAKERLMAKKKK